MARLPSAAISLYTSFICFIHATMPSFVGSTYTMLPPRRYRLTIFLMSASSSLRARLSVNTTVTVASSSTADLLLIRLIRASALFGYLSSNTYVGRVVKSLGVSLVTTSKSSVSIVGCCTLSSSLHEINIVAISTNVKTFNAPTAGSVFLNNSLIFIIF